MDGLGVVPATRYADAVNHRLLVEGHALAPGGLAVDNAPVSTRVGSAVHRAVGAEHARQAVDAVALRKQLDVVSVEVREPQHLLMD